MISGMSLGKNYENGIIKFSDPEILTVAAVLLMLLICYFQAEPSAC